MISKKLGIVLGTLLCLAYPALADTITVTSTALSSTMFNPSSDGIALNAGSATLSAPGNVIFQTGNITVGDSAIADQIIPFLFNDTVTINGVSKVLTIFGQDNVTSTADLITIFGSGPISFGAYTFNLDRSDYTATAVGQNIAVNLSGTVAPSPVPEPGTLPLLATGLMGGAFATTRIRRFTEGV